MRFREFVQEDRRLEILLFLAATAGFGASHYLLHTAVDSVGHVVSMDTLKADLYWLGEQGLVDVNTEGESFIVRLKQRGMDVAEGRTVHPGVKRPKPE